MVEMILVKIAPLGRTVREVIMPDGAGVSVALLSSGVDPDQYGYEDIRINGKQAGLYSPVHNGDIITLIPPLKMNPEQHKSYFCHFNKSIGIMNPENMSCPYLQIPDNNDMHTGNCLYCAHLETRGGEEENDLDPDQTSPEEYNEEKYNQKFLTENPDFLEVD